MWSLVTHPFDLSLTHDSAAFAIPPPGSALRAVARERAHDTNFSVLAVGQLGGSVHVRHRVSRLRLAQRGDRAFVKIGGVTRLTHSHTPHAVVARLSGRTV